jgi:ABC-type branched-subunit amino acid transport system substrate-binding protein
MAEAATAPQIWLGAAKKLGLAATLLALAACQTMVPRRRPPPAPSPTPVEVETPRGIGPELPDDAERHRVALLVPLSGPNAAVGQSIANAANLAVLDTGGKRIRITTYDTGTGASNAASRAVNEGNKIILGPLLAEDARLVAPVAQRARVPVISFSNDTGVAGNGVFIMGYTPGESIDRVVRYARSRGMTKFAGLTPTGVYGQRAANALLRSVENAGGQVVALQSFDRSRGGISAAITKMGANSPYEAVLVADAARTASQAVPLLRKSAPSAKVLGTELWNTESALPTMIPLHGAWFASVTDGLYRQLANKYRGRFASAPYRISSMGYDAVLLVSRIAQDWRPGSEFPMGRLVDKDGFTGIDGPFRFRRDGVVERALEVSQVGSNGQTVVSPPPARFTD